jgi:hypothetical protein
MQGLGRVELRRVLFFFKLHYPTYIDENFHYDVLVMDEPFAVFAPFLRRVVD